MHKLLYFCTLIFLVRELFKKTKFHEIICNKEKMNYYVKIKVNLRGDSSRDSS